MKNPGHLFDDVGSKTFKEYVRKEFEQEKYECMTVRLIVALVEKSRIFSILTDK